MVRIDYKPAINVGSITFDQPWTGLTPDFPKGRLGFYKGGPLFTVHGSLFTFSKGQGAGVLAPSLFKILHAYARGLRLRAHQTADTRA